MRKLLPFLVAVLLLPSGAGAQGTPRKPDAIKEAPRQVTSTPAQNASAPGVSAAQAESIALLAARADLSRGTLRAFGNLPWAVKIPSASLTAHTVRSVQANGRSVHIVALPVAARGGMIRVVVDATTGAVISTMAAGWDWGAAPAWWKDGLDAPPARR